jgi:hypothetical protein
MSIKEQYKTAYRLIRYCGDFATFHTLCYSYGIDRPIRNSAFVSYYHSQEIDYIGETYRNQVLIKQVWNAAHKNLLQNLSRGL